MNARWRPSGIETGAVRTKQELRVIAAQSREIDSEE
jgi:hypothetical protein